MTHSRLVSRRTALKVGVGAASNPAASATDRARRLGLVLLAILATAVIGGPDAQAQPAGTYTETCRDSRIVMLGEKNNRPTLMSVCQTRNGAAHGTSLANVDQCRGDIQNDDGYLVCDMGGVPPVGTYTQTCEVTTVQGTTLHSHCRDNSGALHTTELASFDKCQGNIFNENGTLGCNTGSPPPNGSYTQSCRDISAVGNLLTGFCKNRSGNFNATQLDSFDQCKGDIMNDNGTLRCMPRSQ